MKPYNADFIEVASIDEEQPDYYGNYELSDVYGGKKRQRFNFKYKYRFKGESKWEIVDIRSLRSVTPVSYTHLYYLHRRQGQPLCPQTLY